MLFLHFVVIFRSLDHLQLFDYLQIFFPLFSQWNTLHFRHGGWFFLDTAWFEPEVGEKIYYNCTQEISYLICNSQSYDSGMSGLSLRGKLTSNCGVRIQTKIVYRVSVSWKVDVSHFEIIYFIYLIILNLAI